MKNDEKKNEERFVRRAVQARTAQGITQAEMAAATGLHRATMAKIEIGLRRVRLEDACRIASALGCDLAQMVSAEPMTATWAAVLD